VVNLSQALALQLQFPAKVRFSGGGLMSASPH
jgi:hypothetical protein